MSRCRDELREQLADDLTEMASLGVIESVTDEDIQTLVDEYDSEYSLEERLGTVGKTYVVAQLLFEFLRKRNRALFHDTESIYGYVSYGELLEEYAGLTDGALHNMTYEIHGDWDQNEDALIVVELNGERVENTMRYAGDWMDLDSFVRLLNRLLRDATDEERRLSILPVGAGQAAHIAFVRPDQADRLKEYFQEALDSYKKQRDE